MSLIDPLDYPPRTTIYNHPDWKYHAAPGLSSTQLKCFVNYSPRHYQYRYIDGYSQPKQSDAMLLGSLVHCLVLEPDKVSQRYDVAITPEQCPDSLRTVEQLKDYCREHGLMTSGNKADLIGRVQADDPEVSIWDVMVSRQKDGQRQIIKAELWDTARRMRDAVFKNPDACDLLKTGKPEVSVWADYDDTGQLIKCRCDWLREDGVAVDLKTCACASPATFARDCAKYGYGLQEAHYRAVLTAASHSLDEFIFIAVDSEPPYLCHVYLLNEVSRDLSAKRHALAIQQLAACQQYDQWPGYCDHSREISLPGWHLKQLENEL